MQDGSGRGLPFSYLPLSEPPEGLEGEGVEVFYYRSHSGEEVDLVLEGPGGRVVGVEVKTGELRLEHVFQALLAWAAWTRLEGRVGLQRKTFAVLWRPDLGFPLYLKVPDPELLLARAREAMEALLAARPKVGPGCKGCPLAREGVARRAWPTWGVGREPP